MSASVVFIGGISGVFFGMTLIYLSMRITAGIVTKLDQKAKEKAKEAAK